MRFRRSDRIIPARAGFTIRILRLVIWPPDHPRSRGVYSRRAGCAGARPGSSPLARGLHWKAGAAVRLLGIIPARAGFTNRAVRSRTVCADHPRSRGVYPDGDVAGHHLGGSSPLARGLLFLLRQVRQGGRIIPARAGFTMSGSVVSSSVADHPRSRGVYCAQDFHASRSFGSSPLARGLRPGARSPESSGRIIPARAGFTAARKGHRGRHQDHPRSRGVYAPRPGPAGRRSSFVRAGDHPRSRGVYGDPAAADHPAPGSSPLARGLRRRSPSQRARTRIIPARAGFTGRKPEGGLGVADHPRSRGVYPTAGRKSSGREGSSPLARGLPRTERKN